jgi:hypothetical protein
MPRPPSDRVEQGFTIWSTEADRNDTRTAELMGVPQSTVSYWHRTYHWDERYLTFNQSDGQLMAGVALAGMRAGLPAVTARLLHIATAKTPVFDAAGQPIGEVYAAQDRDAIQAAKLLVQYGLGDPPAAGWPGAIAAQGGITPEEIRAALHDGDVGAAASRIIEATVQASYDRPPRSPRR